MHSLKHIAEKTVIIVLLLTLAATVYLTQQAMDRYQSIRFVNREAVFLPKGEVLKWLSMGYRGAVSDWLWIRTVLYVGRRLMDEDNPYFEYAVTEGTIHDEIRQVRDEEKITQLDSVYLLDDHLKGLLHRFESRGLVVHVYPMLERLTTVDPYFKFPYIFGGVFIMMETGEITAARELLEKGYRYYPDHWEFPFYLGWIQWMYRGEMDLTQKYLLEALQCPGCPDYVGDLLLGLTRNLGSESFAALYLSGIHESTDNPEIRRQVHRLMIELQKSPGAH